MYRVGQNYLLCLSYIAGAVIQLCNGTLHVSVQVSTAFSFRITITRLTIHVHWACIG